MWKLLAVAISVAGVTVIALFAKKNGESDSGAMTITWLGCLLVVSSTILYGLYEVVFKKFCIPKETKSPVFNPL